MEPWELTHDEYMAAINNPDRGSATVGTRRDPFESVADAAQKKLWGYLKRDIALLKVRHEHSDPEMGCGGCEQQARLERVRKAMEEHA